jgi:predicted CXXCH cytochrome family protein
VILRIVRDKPVAGRAFFRQAVLSVDKLTIGRDADQLIQVQHARLAPAHAVIELERGLPRLRVLVPTPVPVNGVPQRRKLLARGDVIGLGAGRLEVQDIRANGVLVLRLDLLQRANPSPAGVKSALTLKDAGIRATPASLVLSGGVLLLMLLIPLLTAWRGPVQTALRESHYVPSDTLWQPGTLHESHQSIGTNCNACHLRPFERVEDSACLTCHQDTQHHVPADSPVRARFETERCTSCHVEHAHPSRLIERGPASCTQCHADLKRLDGNTRLQNAVDFGSDHPELALAMLKPPADAGTPWVTEMMYARGSGVEERSNLKFSHKVHLNPAGIKAPTGERKLSCADCHQTDASGRTMLRVRMETHCAGCHTLQFDEHDPSTVVPHGALGPVFAAIEAHFSRMFLKNSGGIDASVRRRPGGEGAVLSRDEQRRALDWTTQQTTLVARELLDKRVCVQCHFIDKKADSISPAQWQIRPVKLAEQWMPRAQFSHAAHRASSCATCHIGAEQSDASTDVLMPAIRQCRDCHGGANDTIRLASDCVMCHQLHIPGRGPMLTGVTP